jgi:hypothetical protein
MGSGGGSVGLAGVGALPLPSGIGIGAVFGARRLGPRVGISCNRDAGAEDGPVVCAMAGRQTMVPAISVAMTIGCARPGRRID